MLTRLGAGGITVEDGNGSRGIVVGRAGDFTALPTPVAFTNDPFKREDYVLRSRADGVWLLGASDLRSRMRCGICSNAWVCGNIFQARPGRSSPLPVMSASPSM